MKKIIKENAKIKLNGKTAGIFVDDANLYYAQKKAGWKVDIVKLIKLLKKEVGISFVNYYIAVPALWDANYKATSSYILRVKKFAEVREKSLKYLLGDSERKVCSF